MTNEFSWQNADAANESDMLNFGADEAEGASDAESLGAADQRLDAATTSEVLDADRDHEALADEPSAAGAAEDYKEGTIVGNIRPTGDSADKPRDHVRVLRMNLSDHVVTGDTDVDEAKGKTDAYADGPEDGSLEMHHDGPKGEGTVAGMYVDDGKGNLHFEHIDLADDMERGEPQDAHDGSWRGAEEDAPEVRHSEHGSMSGSDIGDGDEPEHSGSLLSGTLGKVGDTIKSGSSRALEAWRRGPGERMINDKLYRQGTRVGRQALRRTARQARRDAPLRTKRTAASTVRYHGASIIREERTRFISDTRKRWEDEGRLGLPPKEDEDE